MADSHSISIGDTFNRWTLAGPIIVKKTGSIALFRCQCGTERMVKVGSVKFGSSKSCGCQRIDSARQQLKTHGRSQDGAGSAYASWESLFGRCYNPKSPAYGDYGGRGIKVCDRWHAFENFLEDMGERPPGTSIDRYPNKNGDYEPGNCRWATQTEQMFNTRKTLLIEYEGKQMTLADLSSLTGVNVDTIRRRLSEGMNRPGNRGGWLV